MQLGGFFGSFLRQRPVNCEEKPSGGLGLGALSALSILRPSESSSNAASSAPGAMPAPEVKKPEPQQEQKQEEPKGMQLPDTSTPVQLENFQREWSSISHQDNFDGFRLEAAKQVNKYLQTSHSLFLGTSLREGGYIYQMGPTYTTEDGSTAMVGRVGVDGTVNGRLIKKVTDALELKANINSSLSEEQRNMCELAADYTAKDWASSFKLAWQGTWILNGAFSQVITPRLQAGGELTYVAANGASIGAIAARYNTGKHVLYAQLSRQPDFKQAAAGPQGMAQSLHSLKLNYLRRISERLSLGAEFEYTHPDMESAARFAYEYTFRHARVQGLVDTSGKVSCFIQDMAGFGVSGMIDYHKSDYKFGFMMHVVPPPPEGAGGPGGLPPF